MMNNKLKIAILGSGNIGTDLLIKCLRSSYLDCTLFIGRRLDSKGINIAKQLGVKVSDKRIDAIINNPSCCDLVFDATTALDHIKHWKILKKFNKKVIDMTPSQVGNMVIPAVNIRDSIYFQNVNMVSCGGQASIPMAFAISQVVNEIEYIEVVSSIASASAGFGTRLNLDEYIENTEKGLMFFTKCKKVKVILILNPASPCIDMQTTISVKLKRPDLEKLNLQVGRMEKYIRSYVPGYKIIIPPVYEKNRVVVMLKVRGIGDYLPKYAGNLDIINCAAITTAEEYYKSIIRGENA
jgi:acetaldehyde dehydrogenase (acetylating)